MEFPMVELSEYPVAASTALRSTCLPTAPARPPDKKLPSTAAFPGEEFLRYPLPPEPRIAPVRLLPAIKSSAIMFPPVLPTLMPRDAIKESIFWLTFKNAMAHKNQTNTFPVTASFP